VNSDKDPEIQGTPEPPGTIEAQVDEVVRIETILRDLWEKLRSSARNIHDLREERNALRDKVSFLEQELEHHKVGIQKKETEIKALRAEHLQLVNSNGKNALTEEEREFLKTKIRDLIVKINSYL
jgi:SMC interacting uncharacterized protein involved in chromosome segregation